MQASKQRSSLLAKLPRAANGGEAMSSKIEMKQEVKSEVKPEVKAAPKPATIFMPNSMKNRNVPTIGSKVKKEVKQEPKPQKQEDSDDDEPFFSFTTKEEAQEELKTHKLEAGPSRPTRDMIRLVLMYIGVGNVLLRFFKDIYFSRTSSYR